jgi:YfiH family protein
MIGMEQIHSNNVVRVSKIDDGTIIKGCDALISDDPEVILSVRVADCLPISVVDKKSHSFGIIHAGWRGLHTKIIIKTIEKMVKDYSSSPVDLMVTIGPHICQKHYEVKGDVSSKFVIFPGSIFKESGKDFLDLAKVAELQLIGAGVKRENIQIDKRCTFEDKNLFSYRRDKTDKRNIFYNSFH